MLAKNYDFAKFKVVQGEYKNSQKNHVFREQINFGPLVIGSNAVSSDLLWMPHLLTQKNFWLLLFGIS